MSLFVEQQWATASEPNILNSAARLFYDQRPHAHPHIPLSSRNPKVRLGSGGSSRPLRAVGTLEVRLHERRVRTRDDVFAEQKLTRCQASVSTSRVRRARLGPVKRISARRWRRLRYPLATVAFPVQLLSTLAREICRGECWIVLLTVLPLQASFSANTSKPRHPLGCGIAFSGPPPQLPGYIDPWEEDATMCDQKGL